MSLISIRLTAEYGNTGRKVLDDLHLDVFPGEAVGLIGESGSGKSTLALALLRLLDWKNGSESGWILWKGRDLLQLTEREMREIRGREIALVLQSAATSLNPAMKIATQFQEAWRAHSKEKFSGSRGAGGAGLARTRVLLADVNLPWTDEFLNRYPGEISLGQAQRVLIALSLLHQPDLVIADEPTSALDTITQREVLELLTRLRREHGMATLFISHDLLSVGAFCHRVAILKDGKIVEQGPTAQIFSNPQHEYTKRLIQALPALPVLQVEAEEDEDEEDEAATSLANLAELTQSGGGKLIAFPGAMLEAKPPCAEASKPSAVRSLPSPTKR